MSSQNGSDSDSDLEIVPSANPVAFLRRPPSTLTYGASQRKALLSQQATAKEQAIETARKPSSTPFPESAEDEDEEEYEMPKSSGTVRESIPEEDEPSLSDLEHAKVDGEALHSADDVVLSPMPSARQPVRPTPAPTSDEPPADDDAEQGSQSDAASNSKSDVFGAFFNDTQPFDVQQHGSDADIDIFGNPSSSLVHQKPEKANDFDAFDRLRRAQEEERNEVPDDFDALPSLALPTPHSGDAGSSDDVAMLDGDELIARAMEKQQLILQVERQRANAKAELEPKRRFLNREGMFTQTEPSQFGEDTQFTQFTEFGVTPRKEGKDNPEDDKEEEEDPPFLGIHSSGALRRARRASSDSWDQASPSPVKRIRSQQLPPLNGDAADSDADDSDVEAVIPVARSRRTNLNVLSDDEADEEQVSQNRASSAKARGKKRRNQEEFSEDDDEQTEDDGSEADAEKSDEEDGDAEERMSVSLDADQSLDASTSLDDSIFSRKRKSDEMSNSSQSSSLPPLTSSDPRLHSDEAGVEEKEADDEATHVDKRARKNDMFAFLGISRPEPAEEEAPAELTRNKKKRGKSDFIAGEAVESDDEDEGKLGKKSKKGGLAGVFSDDSDNGEEPDEDDEEDDEAAAKDLEGLVDDEEDEGQAEKDALVAEKFHADREEQDKADEELHTRATKGQLRKSRPGMGLDNELDDDAQDDIDRRRVTLGPQKRKVNGEKDGLDDIANTALAKVYKEDIRNDAADETDFLNLQEFDSDSDAPSSVHSFRAGSRSRPMGPHLVDDEDDYDADEAHTFNEGTSQLETISAAQVRQELQAKAKARREAGRRAGHAILVSDEEQEDDPGVEGDAYKTDDNDSSDEEHGFGKMQNGVKVRNHVGGLVKRGPGGAGAGVAHTQAKGRGFAGDQPASRGNARMSGGRILQMIDEDDTAEKHPMDLVTAIRPLNEASAAKIARAAEELGLNDATNRSFSSRGSGGGGKQNMSSITQFGRRAGPGGAGAASSGAAASMKAGLGVPGSGRRATASGTAAPVAPRNSTAALLDAQRALKFHRE